MTKQTFKLREFLFVETFKVKKMRDIKIWKNTRDQEKCPVFKQQDPDPVKNGPDP